MKNNKLSIEKFRILEMSKLSNVQGGTGGHGGATDMSTLAGSVTTTYTTDPNEPCPIEDTSDQANTYDTIPTLNSK